jgi:hypothetical protein
MSEAPGTTLACRLLGAEFAARRAKLSDDLFSNVAETVEEAQAFAFRFPATDDILDKVFAFIREERQCCPFFAFDVHVEPEGGPLWLRVGGSAEAKRFFLEELGIGIPQP